MAYTTFATTAKKVEVSRCLEKENRTCGKSAAVEDGGRLPVKSANVPRRHLDRRNEAELRTVGGVVESRDMSCSGTRQSDQHSQRQLRARVVHTAVCFKIRKRYIRTRLREAKVVAQYQGVARGR